MFGWISASLAPMNGVTNASDSPIRKFPCINRCCCAKLYAGDAGIPLRKSESSSSAYYGANETIQTQPRTSSETKIDVEDAAKPLRKKSEASSCSDDSVNETMHSQTRPSSQSVGQQYCTSTIHTALYTALFVCICQSARLQTLRSYPCIDASH